jgi:tetratricopeptide (TPR) repeat protein
VRRHMGDYRAARQAYETSLVIAETLDDGRQIGVVNGQLGTLAMLEGNLAEAETRHQSALATFRNLGEPTMEATALHQLGVVYQEAEAWEQAEQAYRAASQLHEAQGNLAGAARTWNQLAIVLESIGKLQEAEAWYRKAIETSKSAGNIVQTARSLSYFANLLAAQGGDRLAEASQLAEEAVVLKQTLDPSAAEIWRTYDILAQIATQQGEATKAQNYRQQARQSFASSRDVQHNEGVVEVIIDAEVRRQ